MRPAWRIYFPTRHAGRRRGRARGSGGRRRRGKGRRDPSAPLSGRWRRAFTVAVYISKIKRATPRAGIRRLMVRGWDGVG